MPLSKVVKSPWQPRREFAPEALQELAASIKENGVLQPLLVRKKGNQYELIAGERRFRASQAAGLTDVPVILQEATDEVALELALIENIQREDLNLIEEAEGYRLLMQTFGLTQEAVAKKVGKARATVTNALRLLDLSDGIKRLLAEGAITAGHAKAILGLDNSKERDLLAAKTATQGLSVRTVEKLVAAMNAGRGRKTVPAPVPAVSASAKEEKHLRFLAEKIQQELGTKVQLTPVRLLADGRRETGRIVIEYFDHEDLSRLLETMNLGDLL